MNISKEKGQVFHSMTEFEKKFFPKYFKKRMLKKSQDDARKLGIIMAEESLGKIRKELA